MTKMGCGLKGSRFFCKEHPGACCADCVEVGRCDRACRNHPARCGYAVPSDPCTYTPAWRQARQQYTRKKETNAKLET